MPAAEHGVVAFFFWAALLLRVALLATLALWLVTVAARLLLRGRQGGRAGDALVGLTALGLAALALALALRPDAAALERLATRAFAGGDYERAIDLARRAESRRGPGLELLMARALERTGDLPGALAALERAQALQPETAAAYFEAARLLAAQGRRDLARRELDQARSAVRSETERRAARGLSLALGLEKP